MVTLSSLHYVFVIVTLIILIALLCKKEIVIPCIIGILLIGFTFSGNLIHTIQILNNALIASCVELFGIILVIALVTAMSKAMYAIGADEMMIRPIRKIIKTPDGAFWGIGLAMLIVSWLIWPSPAVALIGALLLPVAAKVGLPAIWAAVAMNIMGHGMGLSSDFFVQGAPAISAKAAGIPVETLIKASVPLWFVMSVTVGLTAYIAMRRELKYATDLHTTRLAREEMAASVQMKMIKKPRLALAMSLLIVLSFATIITVMIKMHIVGGDATALVAGTALILTCVLTMADSGLNMGLEDCVSHLKEGFIFAIRIFAPVIVIAAFFFLGSQDFAVTVLGEGAPGLLNDIGLFITERMPMSKGSIAFLEVGLGVITGLDGSGFSGLPLVGSMAQTFSLTTTINTAVLTALGQITTIWVGGGTIIPWGVIPVAAICGVSPTELARKNLIFVLIGLAVTTVFAIFLL